MMMHESGLDVQWHPDDQNPLGREDEDDQDLREALEIMRAQNRTPRTAAPGADNVTDNALDYDTMRRNAFYEGDEPMEIQVGHRQLRNILVAHFNFKRKYTKEIEWL
jgi:hypothetical protein